MSYDKVIDSTQLDGAMTATANAIRSKTGDAAQIPWDADTGFAAAVAAIPSGDPNPTAEENDVIFIDYDGTIRYSYTAEEFLALTELPPNPTHDGLVAQGWNWTLADAQEYVGKYGIQVIGQSYITESGATEFDIVLENDRFVSPTITFSQTVSNGVTFDWGDGSETETVSGTGARSVSHPYSALGAYTIRALCADGGTVSFHTGNDNLFGTTQAYRNILRHVRIGKNYATELYRGTFVNSRLLETVTIPIGVTSTGQVREAFSGCCNLRGLVFPAGSTGPNLDNAMNGCCSAVYVSLPKTCTKIGWYGMIEMRNLKKICLPENLTTSNASNGGALNSALSLKRLSIGNGGTIIGGLSALYSLTSLTVPASFETFYQSALQSLTSLQFFRLESTAPPVAATSSAFGNLPTFCIIYIPYSALAAYLTATNYPDPATYTYLGFATYESGATLPTQDTTEAYNVTWYASKADAAAGTSPITTGNGKEIYCTYTEVSA